MLLFLFVLFVFNLQGQNDSTYSYIERDLLGLENLKEWKDTSGIKVISASRSAKNIEDNTFNPLHYLDKKVQTITLNENDYIPSKITDDILTQNGMTSEEFINQYYEPQYEGELTFPAMEDLLSASHQIGFEIKYRGFNISYNNMIRKAHSSIGRSSYLYKYNDPQNYWGEKIQQTVISYDRKWENIYFFCI